MDSIKKLCTDHAVWVKELQELGHSDLKTHRYYWEKQLCSILANPALDVFDEVKTLLIRTRSSQLKERLKEVEKEARSVIRTLEENPIET